MSDIDYWQGARRVLPEGAVRSAVLLLHGLGSNADDLIALATILAPLLPHTAFISPNAPEPCDMAPFGHQWFSLREWTQDSMLRGIRQSAPVLERMIADVSHEFTLPFAKIALTGFSQGCMMALHVAPRLAEPLAGVVGLSGALVGDGILASEIRSRPPVLLVHGQMDPVVPYGAMAAASTVLQRNNVPVKTVTRPLMAHNIDDVTLEETAAFLAKNLGEG